MRNSVLHCGAARQAPDPRVMAVRGAVLYLCDAPSGLDFGIDCMTYETGPRFRGVSMIPAGLHVVYYSTGHGAPQGSFFYCKDGDVIVRSWDTANEELSATNILSAESTRELLSSLERGLLNDQLGPYPFAQHHTWLNLSSNITLNVLIRAGCEPGIVLVPGGAAELDPASFSASPTTPHSQSATAKFANIELVQSSLRELLAKGHDRTEALTAMYRDKSPVLTELVKSYFDQSWSDLVGEVQLAFLLFLLLYSYPALVYWKSAIHLIASSEKALRENVTFTGTFIKSLHAQLNFSPADFFEMELSRENFLRPTLSALFSSLSFTAGDLPEPLPEFVQRLQRFVSKKFDLALPNLSRSNASSLNDHEEESYNLVEEDMPVIVGIDEEPRGGVDERVDAMSAVASIEQKWNSLIPPSDNNVNHRGGGDGPDSMGRVGEEEEEGEEEPDQGQDLSPSDIESAKYSWRYPFLYQAMLASCGREDMIMTAARILDDGEAKELPHTRREAELFIEHESFFL